MYVQHPPPGFILHTHKKRNTVHSVFSNPPGDLRWSESPRRSYHRPLESIFLQWSFSAFIPMILLDRQLRVYTGLQANIHHSNHHTINKFNITRVNMNHVLHQYLHGRKHRQQVILNLIVGTYTNVYIILN